MRVFLLFLVFSFSQAAFAQSWELAPSGGTLAPACDAGYRIEGPSQGKVGSSYEYRIAPSDENSTFSWTVTFSLVRNGKTVESVSGKEKYLRYFTTPGWVSLHAEISDENGCGYFLEKEIRLYESILAYVGSDTPWIGPGIAELLDRNNVLFEKYVTASKLSEAESPEKTWGGIAQADVLVVGYKDVLGFFSDMGKFQKTSPIDFSKKRIYVVSDFSKAFLSKAIAAPLSKIGATKAFLISEDQAFGLLTGTFSKADVPSVWQELSYEKTQTVYSLGGLIEFLAYAGFSYQLISLLLAIAVAVLALNFLKQVVGFNVFGIYYPVLFAVTVLSIGLSGAFVFIAIGFASILLVNEFSKRLHLLVNAKRSLLVGIYLVLLLFTLGLDNFFELSLVDYAMFDNLLILFPLLVASVLAEKIFQEDVNAFSRSGLFDAFQYAFITFVAYFVIEEQNLRYLLISYPDAILAVVALNVLVGRYTGLQVFEYFRFMPLLRKLDEEE